MTERYLKLALVASAISGVVFAAAGSRWAWPMVMAFAIGMFALVRRRECADAAWRGVPVILHGRRSNAGRLRSR